jgi:hypothetical protein
MRTSLAQQVNAKLAGLCCSEHGRTPVAECADDGGSIKIQACCADMLARARGQFGHSERADSQGSESPLPQGGGIGKEPVRNDAAKALSSEAETVHGRPPKAFLSHASADKERIVRPLDSLLRARGIDVWLDERDLLPGRNLVAEIFTHGISKSDVVIVVLSKNSIERPWFTEELSVAVVQKINGLVKLIIPVVVDGVQPPAALVATVWERIPDLGNLELHADRIAASIFGAKPPPIAPIPAYAGIPVHRLAGLDANDERIFVFACEQLLATPVAHPIVDLGLVAARAQQLEMPEEQVFESVSALEQAYFLHKLSHYLGHMRPLHARIPGTAFERYLEAYRPSEYRIEKRAILSAIVNHGANHSRAIAQELRIHEYIVDHVLEAAESAGHVNALHSMDGIHIMAKPTLARLLREMDSEN